MTFYVGDKFSLSMMKESGRVVFQRLSNAGAKAMMEDATEYTSIASTETAAWMIEQEVGKKVSVGGEKLKDVSLTTDDQMLIMQAQDFVIQWWLVFRQA